MDKPVEIIDKIIEINSHKIKLKFIRIYQTFMVWIGDPSDPKLESLALAIGDNSTSIIADRPQLDSIADQEMANKLSHRFNDNRPVYVAYNYLPAMENTELKLQIDQQLIEFIRSIHHKS
ncbi:hypothetical protein BLA29_007539 [Euroglyphus maynei]|uniref:Uncharacterized protein n=1 Tax=Euroglyphus maynei TaxID=6958 RepID=A0A1Y3ANZ4_EURMA|nr:hypothetical protein BLA29_007539 [Euroglyphus maynei]